MSQSLTERYDDRIAGMLSCYDRLVITGTLPVVCYAAGMTGGSVVVQRRNPGGEVIQCRQVGDVAPVAAKQNQSGWRSIS
jgi:hypothetical protein